MAAPTVVPSHRTLMKQLGVKSGEKISIGDLMRKSKDQGKK